MLILCPPFRRANDPGIQVNIYDNSGQPYMNGKSVRKSYFQPKCKTCTNYLSILSLDQSLSHVPLGRVGVESQHSSRKLSQLQSYLPQGQLCMGNAVGLRGTKCIE